MNLKLQPSKCCSLFIISGSPKPICFTLSELTIFLYDKPHTYLGSVVTHSASPGFSFLHDKLSSSLSNIDSSLVRFEYLNWKATLPTHYHLFAFILLSTTSQNSTCFCWHSLHAVAWLSLPPCATTSVIYDSVSQKSTFYNISQYWMP